VKDDAELVPEQIFLKLELAFVEREKQALSRQLQDPETMVDAVLTQRLHQTLNGLLQRDTTLGKQLKELRRKSFSR
jgi:hypothetical protein